jgi:enterochelin esterase family protein
MEQIIRAFEQLQTQVATSHSAAEQQALADAFVAQQPLSPLVGASEAIIFYTGLGDEILVRGDMLGEESAPLVRLGQTTLRYYRGQYESDARLDYHLLVDGVDIGDPRNPRRTPSGYGPRAELRMPGYRDPQTWLTRPDVAHGTVTTCADFTSERYPSTRTVWVYTPPDYDDSRRYPSVYFQDGGDYLEFGAAAAIFDNLIADGAIPPSIGVFIDPSREHGRVVDYDLNADYSAFVCDELVPWINQRYATEAAAERRAIVGASFGGLIALFTAQRRPDIFGLVGSQSGFVSRNDAAIIRTLADSEPLPLKIHLIIGTYETHVGPLDRGEAEADFLAGNRSLRDLLEQRGYRYAYAEYHDGHAWALWRARLGDALSWLLGG